MAIATEKSAETFLNIVVSVPLNCIFPLYAEDEIEVIYGYNSLQATLNVDYTVTLDGPNYDQFTVTPLAALLTKINDLIAADESDPAIEINYVTVRRKLDFLTSVQPETVRQVAFLSREIERIHMRLIQLNEILKRTLLFPPKNIGVDEVNHYVKDAPIPGALLAWDSTGTQIVNFEGGSDDADLSGLIAQLSLVNAKAEKALDGIRTVAAENFPHVVSPLVGIASDDLSGNLTFVTPAVTAVVNGFKAVGAPINSSMPSDTIRHYYLGEDQQWLMKEIGANLYTEIERYPYPDKIKVWEIQSSTKVDRISMVGPTWRQRIRPDDYYGTLDRMVESYYIKDNTTPWAATTDMPDYGMLVVTDENKVYQVVKPGISGATAPTALVGDEEGEPIIDGDAELFFVGMKDWLGVFRYGVNNGVEGYFSFIAICDGMHKRTLTDSPLAVPRDTPMTELALKHIKTHLYHLVMPRVDGGTYKPGMLMTQDDWIWRNQTLVDGDAAADASAFGGAYSVGSTVVDGDLTWRAIMPHYDNTTYAFVCRVQTDFISYFPADAHDSSASMMAKAIGQYGKIAGTAAMLTFLNEDSPIPDGVGTYYTYYELFDMIVTANLTTQISDSLTKTFQNDVNPFAGGIYNVQFLEDNCESVEGFRFAAYIYDAMGETAKRDQALADEITVDQFGVAGLYNVFTRRYAWHFGNDTTTWPEFPGWYPYGQSQWFPEKCNLRCSTSSIRYQVRQQMQEQYPNWLQDKSRNFFPDNFLGVIAAKSWQDTDKAYNFVENFERRDVNISGSTINEYMSYLLTKDYLHPPYTLLNVEADGITVSGPDAVVQKVVFPT